MRRLSISLVGALASRGRLVLCAALLALAPAWQAGATDIVGLGADLPEVRFDIPRAVLVRGVTPDAEAMPSLAVGERLVAVELPVSVVVAKGDVRRVGEVVIEVDGAAAGLTVHDYAPATRLESEYTGAIQVESTTESDRHLDGTLGGILPSAAGVAQLAPSLSAGKASRDAATEKAARLAPKEAIVVAGAINRRQGVLFKFRPSSQTTLEGERRLAVTFIAPQAWEGGELSVACAASGQRKVLFVKQRKIWGSARAPVTLRLAGAPVASARPAAQTVAKPVVSDSVAPNPAAPVEGSHASPQRAGLRWKRRAAPGF
ncbi:MAG: hypothetical protein AAGB00_11695 [Planctomycetota bacterium]